MPSLTPLIRTGRESLSLLTGFLQNISLPCLIVDDDLQCVYYNPAFIRFLGGSEDNHDQFDQLCRVESVLGFKLMPSHRTGGLCSIASDANFQFSSLKGEKRHCSLKFYRLDLGGNNLCVYLFEDQSETVSLSKQLTRKNNEISLISQVASALGSKSSFEEILQIILVAVTAREGLGFNRAMLFMYDDRENCLMGHSAIGPSTPSEAGRIWESLPDEGKSLEEILNQYAGIPGYSSEGLAKKIRSVKIPLKTGSKLLESVLFEKRGEIICAVDCLCELDCRGCLLHDAGEFAAVPMVTGDNVLGVIVADNLITARPISSGDLSRLKTFADQAAVAIERSRLYESLEANLVELEATNQNLINAQDELLKLEKVSLWSELTYDIAHELRNPASIIGGFAALMQKSNDLPEHIREQSDIIFAECQRLEKAINTVLDFSKSFSQEKSDFNLPALIREVLELMNARLLNLNALIDRSFMEHDFKVNARRDQIKFAMFTILSLLSEKVNPDQAVNIGFHTADKSIKAVICPQDTENCNNDVLAGLVNPRVGRHGLKLNMAIEVIHYNGGQVGVESGDTDMSSLFLLLPQAR
ncbi:MAG: GAF domain-containing protein [candidate division Zixibacteria bacterium]|nr:GAF domain-containing protein [candidate division Zixibacteria bacterium]